MDEKLYQVLKWTAIVMAIAWVGWTFYDGYFSTREAGDTSYLTAERSFSDAQYAEAVQQFNQALAENPQHIAALRGKARSLLQLERYPEALQAFNQAIAQAPDFAASYANRGILYDRLGNYDAALADYEQALKLDAELAKGPGWITRFFRLQTEKPATIDARARYLKAELAKPEAERVLRQPEADAQQRPYKQ